MSMPNIPDITPEINITLEDSINLLLSSIAEEEFSLAKLMDAEMEKILHVLNKYKNNKAEVGDLLSINNSVDKTVINLIKMQMLLQFKLENVKELMPTPIPCKPCRPCKPPPPPPCCCTPCKCNKFWCLLIGKSWGEVSNKSDEFYCRKANLCAFVSSRDFKNNIITYDVGHDCASLYFTAYANNIKIECPCECENECENENECECESETKPDETKVWGKGTLIRMVKYKKITANVNFELLIWDDKIGKTEKNGFQMIIKSSEDQAVIHNSGFVESHSCGKGLNLYCYSNSD